MADPNDPGEWLRLDDEVLLRQCAVEVYRSSGPGGQHRNKVSTAVRLRHTPTGIIAHGEESRSQQENRQTALGRLRMNIALRLRRPAEATRRGIPEVVRSCLFASRQPGMEGRLRIQVGRKDRRFWAVAAHCLDLLEAFEGSPAAAAGHLGVTTSNLVSILKSERHLLAAAQELRKRHGHGPLM